MTLIILLQALNGWFNGMGWPPSGKTMVHWFSARERGRVVSLWNTAHNVGGGLVAALAVVGVGLFNDWGAKFYFNAMVAAAIAVLVYVLLRDSPQSCGLPPIEMYRNDRPPNYSEHSERTLGFREIFFWHVLNNRLLWAIAAANAFVYFVRYGVQNWIPTYLETAKGFSFHQSSAAWFMFEYAAIPGTILCGWVSDRIFGGRRGPATILFMGLTLLGLVVYGLNRTGPLWIDMASLIVIGFFVYGPIMMIGLHALELVPKKAAGTAAGFTGFFGYAFGSAIAGTGVGWIADHWGWGGVFATMIFCCVMAMAFVSLTLKQPARLRAEVARCWASGGRVVRALVRGLVRSLERQTRALGKPGSTACRRFATGKSVAQVKTADEHCPDACTFFFRTPWPAFCSPRRRPNASSSAPCASLQGRVGNFGNSTASIQIGFEYALRPATSSTSSEYQVCPVAVGLNSTRASRGPSLNTCVNATVPAPISLTCFSPVADRSPNASGKGAPGFTFSSLPNITAGSISGP